MKTDFLFSLFFTKIIWNLKGVLNSYKDIMEGSYTTGATVTSYTLTGSKVTQMVYTVGGYKITIAPGATAVIEKTATAPVTP